MSISSDTTTSVRRDPLLTIILVSYMMTVLDGSIVITALQKIRDDLQFSDTDLSWVQNIYTLSFGGLLLLGARAGDIVGRRLMVIIGLSLFTSASLLVGAARSPFWFLSGRAVQGVGAAILAPSTLALLSTNFAEGSQRTRAVAYYGAVAGISASLGLVLGGVLADWLSWRIGFLLNLPIGIAMIVGTLRYIVETDRHSGTFDFVGSLSSTFGMSALVYGIVRSATAGWSDLITIAALAGGVVLLAGFVVNESQAQQPIMPLHLFASRERACAYAARLYFLGGMVGFWFFITQFLQRVIGYNPFQAGLAFLPMTVANFAAAMAVPMGTRRVGNARLLLGGIGLTVVGMAWLSRLSGATGYIAGIAGPMVLLGIGQGITLSPLTVSSLVGVADKDSGAASGLINAVHQLGGSLGLGILVAVFAAGGTSVPDVQELYAHRVAHALTAGTVMLILAFFLVLPLRPRKHSPSRRHLESKQ
jgi:EmrB/QacA subfamily drug resistance transporter